MKQRLQVTITGRVTGVGFRYFAMRAAAEAGVVGFVRNRGRQVEVVAEGETEQLERLLAQLRAGPPGARVDNVQSSLGPATGGFRRFDVVASS